MKHDELKLKAMGERIRYFRGARDWSQEDLAKLAGLHSTYISQLERGKRNPTVLAMLQICEAIEIEMADFFEDI